MTRIDYEAAWEELQELILTRDGWGTRTLVTEMAHLRVKYKQPGTPTSVGPRVEPADGASVPDQSKSEGGRDGSSNSSTQAVAA